MEIARRMPEAGQTLKGRYTLRHLLGEGGFAKTYLADEIARNRQVGVKVLKLNPTAENIAAFSQEVTNMLLLQHDQILKVTDFEAQEKGILPYLVTEYAPLGSLKDYVRRRGQPLGIEETISLLEQASWGIGYAHDTRDLVHRDIKPENLLLLTEDRLVVADFGIAKQLSPQVTLTTEQFSGTVPYAAPEQFQGKSVKASDQYALGVTAFLELTGKLPFSGDSLEMMMKKINGESMSLVQAVEGLRRGERRWTILSALDSVVKRAIDPDASKRFGHITHFPKTLRETYTETVQEKPDKTVHKVVKPYEEPLAGFSLKGSESQKPTVPTTQQNPIKPQVANSVPSQPSIFPLESVQQGYQISPAERQTPNVLQQTNIAVPKSQLISRRNALILLGAAGTIGGIVALDRVLTQSRTAPAGIPGTEITPTPTTTKEIQPGMTLEIYRGHSDQVVSVAWSSDSKYIVSGSNDTTAQVWEAATGRLITDYKGHSDVVKAVAWSPDGKYIVSGSQDGTAQVWEPTTGKVITDYKGHSGWVDSLSWSPDSNQIVSAGADNTVQIWEAKTGNLITDYKGHTGSVWAVSWSHNGNYIASASADTTVQIWEAKTGRLISKYTEPNISGGYSPWAVSVAWSPDSTKVVAGGAHVSVVVLDAKSGNLLGEYKGHADFGGEDGVSWSPNGNLIVSAGDDQTVQVWDPNTGNMVFDYTGHSDMVKDAAWSPNGKYIASCSADNTARVWLAPQ